MKDVKDVKVCRLMSSGSSPVLETSSCACSGCDWQEARDSLTLCNNESAKTCKNCNKAGTGKEPHGWSLLESPNTQYTVYAKEYPAKPAKKFKNIYCAGTQGTQREANTLQCLPGWENTFPKAYPEPRNLQCRERQQETKRSKLVETMNHNERKTKCVMPGAGKVWNCLITQHYDIMITKPNLNWCKCHKTPVQRRRKSSILKALSQATNCCHGWKSGRHV